MAGETRHGDWTTRIRAQGTYADGETREAVRFENYLSVYPGVSAAMAGVYFIPAETAQLDPENEKYKASLKENSGQYE